MILQGKRAAPFLFLLFIGSSSEEHPTPSRITWRGECQVVARTGNDEFTLHCKGAGLFISPQSVGIREEISMSCEMNLFCEQNGSFHCSPFTSKPFGPNETVYH